MNNFLEKYKKFHKSNSENWKKPIVDDTDPTGEIIGFKKISTDEEYNDIYYGKGKHFDRYEKEVIPKIKEYIKWGGISELEALIKCTDPNEFLRQLSSFYSEVGALLFFRNLFGSLSHPSSGFDFEFIYNGEKYRVECVSPKKGKSGLQNIDYSRMRIYTGRDGDLEHQIKNLRIINSIQNKLKQLKKIAGHEEDFNFFLIDITEIFGDTGAIGFSHKNLEDLLYSKKDGRQLSREETKIEITKNEYSYDSSFCSENMKYVHGIFVVKSTSLLDDQKQKVDLYINTNTVKGLPKEFLEKIQSSDISLLSKIFIVIFSVIASLIVVYSIYSYTLFFTAGDQYASFPEIDKKVFHELDALHDAFAEQEATLWDGYAFHEVPLVLVRTNRETSPFWQYAYLIRYPDAEKIVFAKKVSFDDAFNFGPVYRVPLFFSGSAPLWFPSSFGFLFKKNSAYSFRDGTGDYFYFKYNNDRFTDDSDKLDFSNFLLHESFHTYVQRGWVYDDPTVQDWFIAQYPTGEEYIAELREEYALLDALVLASKEDVPALARQYIQKREARMSAYPELKKEELIEAIEGTARYVELKFTNLQTGTQSFDLYGIQSFSFVVTLDDIISKGSDARANSLSFRILYATGAALGYILDKVDVNWKEQIVDSKEKRGKTQYQILKELYQ